MKHTFKENHKLASSTEAKTERDLQRAPEENVAPWSRAAKSPPSLATLECLLSPRHSRLQSRPGTVGQALCTPGHAPLTAKLSVSSRSEGKRNSGSRPAGLREEEPMCSVRTPGNPQSRAPGSQRTRQTWPGNFRIRDLFYLQF